MTFPLDGLVSPDHVASLLFYRWAGFPSIFFILASLAAVHGADWDQWRGPGRDGRSPDLVPLVKTLPASFLTV